MWQGPPTAVDSAGNVTLSYLDGVQPVAWTSTCISQDGVAPHGAANYTNGASSFFAHNCYPAEWQPLSLNTMTEQAAITSYNTATTMLRKAFAHARRRGVKVGVGNEVPAMPPRQLQTTLTYLNAFASTSDHFLTTGYYACEYSTICDWMCGTISGGTRTPCGPAYKYGYPYGHHNVQSWVSASSSRFRFVFLTPFSFPRVSRARTVETQCLYCT